MSSNNYSHQKKSYKYKHVKIDKKRPKLTKGGQNSPSNNNNVKKTKRKNYNNSITGSKGLKIIPLGGLDAIGKNMTVFENSSGMFIVDAGLMFPDDSHPGVDLLLPDYTYVLDNVSKLKGIIITHGHEDHIGALPYLVKDLDVCVDIYATKLTIGLIQCKFEEHKIKNVNFCEVNYGTKINIANCYITFFSMCHSIPASTGLFIECPDGNILHTGDFKFDLTPIDGNLTDLHSLVKFSQTGIDLLMSDSTNASIDSFIPSESCVGPVLERIISEAKGRVIIASFASHIHRIQQVCNAAVNCGRKVILTGRSMVQNTNIARKLGYLHVDDDDIIDAYEVKNIPLKKTVILCTGSQGEPLSALARMSTGRHKKLSIESGDTVVLSASPVPGNEKAVSAIVNNLSKLGANVIDKTNALVHVSGHAYADGLKFMLAIAKPNAVMPIHGEALHLTSHARIAKQMGIDEDNIFVCENGDQLTLKNGNVNLTGHVQSGVVFVDGLSVGDTSINILKERTILGDSGVCIISTIINKKRSSILSKPRVHLRGVCGGEESVIIEFLQKSATNSIKKSLNRNYDINQMKRTLRSALSQLIWEKVKQRPMLVIDIIEM